MTYEPGTFGVAWELTTPTGAALVSVLADGQLGPRSHMTTTHGRTELEIGADVDTVAQFESCCERDGCGAEVGLSSSR